MATFDSGEYVCLSVGSLEGDFIRVGIYKRTGKMGMPRIGYVRISIAMAGAVSDALLSRLDEYQSECSGDGGHDAA